MQHTRQRILTLLKRNGGLTISELSQLLGVSATAVRRHLKALEAQGVASHRTEQRGAGRPSYVYELKSNGPEVFKQSYVAFVDSLLQELVELKGATTPIEVFDRRQEKRQKHYIDRTQGETLTDRVACLARLMESEGRMATWQQLNENRFVLREHNCPFHRLNGDFDYPCRWEMALLQETLKADVQRVGHIRKGDVACVYEIVDQTNGKPVEVPSPRPAALENLAMAA